MKKLKNICLNVLINEGRAITNLSLDDFENLLDVNFNADENYIKFTIKTTYDKNVDLIVKLDVFNSWVKTNKEKAIEVFKDFVLDFLKDSKESEEVVSEIIDDDGNIMSDDDMPINSPTMIVSPKFDLEKIYKTSVPRSKFNVAGSVGPGSVTW